MEQDMHDDHENAGDVEQIRRSRLEAVGVIESALRGDDVTMATIIAGSDDKDELLGAIIGIATAFASVLPERMIAAVLQGWREAAVGGDDG